MCPLNKIHDYFTSALPAPQEGAPSIIGIGATAPVYGDGNITPFVDTNNGNNTNFYSILHTSNAGVNSRKFTPNLSLPNQVTNQVNSSNDYGLGFITKTQALNQNISSSLYADLSSATAISVNDLRYAVQVQLIKETDARYGNRYKEFLLGHFGVVSADARLQIPEYLGSASFSVETQQVAQTSSTDSTTPQGSVAAYSLTNNVSHLFTKSFTEHGYVIVVGGVRVAHRTYSQGLNKL